MTERILVAAMREVAGRYDSFTRDELVASLDRAILELDEALRASVTFEVDSESEPYGNGEYPKLYIKWRRPETDEEMNRRLAHQKQYAEMRVEHERREYERLQKIYGEKK